MHGTDSKNAALIDVGNREVCEPGAPDPVPPLNSLIIMTTYLTRKEWKRSGFIPTPKKGNAKECSNYCTTGLISHASKVMLKILQAKL